MLIEGKVVVFVGHQVSGDELERAVTMMRGLDLKLVAVRYIESRYRIELEFA